MDVGLSCGIAGSDDCVIHRWSAALMAVVDDECTVVFGGYTDGYIELWMVSICYFGLNILVWLVLC
jgi:hypothetical protein